MSHIPYKGLAQALLDLAGGRLDVIISTVASVQPFIESGKLRALAATTLKRLPSFPSVPTMIEAGVPGYEFTTWYGVLVPAGTPAGVVATLNEHVVKAIRAGYLPEEGAREVFADPDQGNATMFAPSGVVCVGGGGRLGRLDGRWAFTSNCLHSKWAGLRTFTPDRHPAAGFAPDAEGFFWLAGQGGFGLQTSPAMAAIVESLIAGTAWPVADVPREALDPDRFVRQSA